MPKASKKAKGKKPGGKGKKKGGKEKKPKEEVEPKTQQELDLIESMKKRLNKAPRPLKVLKEEYHKWLEELHKTGIEPPYYYLPRAREPEKPTPPPETEKVDPRIDPKKWAAMEEKQAGEWNESPIDIETKMVKICSFYKRLNFDGLLDKNRKTIIWNNGLTVVGTLSGNVFLSEGPLCGKYKLDNFHLHFGESCDDGSEHTINGKRYALEMHIEFLPDSCEHCPPKIEERRCNKAVLALLFKVKKEKNHFDLFSLVPNLNEEGRKVELTNNLLCDFNEVLSSSQYYNYTGSCTITKLPNVEWLIFRKVLSIQTSLMTHLWELRKDNCSKSNVRSIKSRGKRALFYPVYGDHLECRKQPTCQCVDINSCPQQLSTEESTANCENKQTSQ